MDSSSLKEKLTCNICGEIYNESDRLPRSFPCLHTFCHQCVQDWYVAKAEFQCPACRKVARGVSSTTDIPVNYAVKDMIPLLQDAAPKEPVPTNTLDLSILDEVFQRAAEGDRQTMEAVVLTMQTVLHQLLSSKHTGGGDMQSAFHSLVPKADRRNSGALSDAVYENVRELLKAVTSASNLAEAREAVENMLDACKVPVSAKALLRAGVFRDFAIIFNSAAVSDDPDVNGRNLLLLDVLQAVVLLRNVLGGRINERSSVREFMESLECVSDTGILDKESEGLMLEVSRVLRDPNATLQVNLLNSLASGETETPCVSSRGRNRQRSSISAHCDPSTGRTYYYDADSNQSSWKKPADFVEAEAAENPLPVHTTARRRSSISSHHCPATGKRFYYDADTGKSTWEIPEDFVNEEAA
eukprot:Rmarinus@m.17777